MSVADEEGRRRTVDAVPYINVTPLIDVLLVLLIIFMVITPSKPSRFKALIPEPPKDEPQQNVKVNELMLRVEIMNDGKLKLNQDVIGSLGDPTPLGNRLAEVFKQRTDQRVVKFGTNEIEKTVFIAAPESMRYGEVAKVIDTVKAAGATPVGLQVDALDQVGK